MALHNVEQRSAQWHAARAGKVTASMISTVLAKSGGSTREDYLFQLVSDQVLLAEGHEVEVDEGFKSAAMVRGAEMEPEARAVYEFYANADVEEIGFVDHPTIRWAGCSPDGLVGDDGLIEMKCPMLKKHMKTVFTRSIDKVYLDQIQWQLASTGRKWCDFVSYHPGTIERRRLFVKRIERDPGRIEYLENAVERFLIEVERYVARWQEME